MVRQLPFSDTRLGWQRQVLREMLNSAPSGDVDQLHLPLMVKRQVFDGQPAASTHALSPANQAQSHRSMGQGLSNYPGIGQSGAPRSRKVSYSDPLARGKARP